MKVFEIHALTTTTLRYKKPPIHNKDLTLVFPVELEKILDKFLSKYDISIEFGFFFWDLKIDIWACVCFTEEHDIGGHVVASRKKKSDVVFTPYSRAPDNSNDDFIPKVGVLYIPSKLACEDLSHTSELFKAIWDELKDYDSRARWLLIMDKLPEKLSQLSAETNKELWLKSNGKRLSKL